MIATLYANTADAWPLDVGVVHVWQFACAQDPGALAAALSAEERHVAARFATQALRDAYIVQHAMMRALLARYVDRVELGRLPRGKPLLVGGGGVEFNLAHCEDVALLAVTRAVEVGVDIERRDAGIDQRAVGRLVRAPSEQDMDFMRVWCRKEACLKTTGVGLVDDLTTVSVNDERVDVCGEIVFVCDLDVGADHAAALATSRQLVKSRMSCVERSAVIATSAVR